MVHLAVDSLFDSLKYGINLVEAMKDSSVCVFSCLILSQINITNKTAIASPPKKTQYFSSWEIINVSRIFKLCFNLNKRRREKNYSK